MLHGKFAVVKLWPKLKTAEDECIARLKISAKALGVECLEVDSFARLIDPPHTQLTSEDVDFVISLHFETPKRYDIFSFVALWNPLQFYHDWGYRTFTQHLLTHDDFLSCSSPWADDHVKRCLVNDPTREGPEFRLYHSLSEPIFQPTAGDAKLFYTGINWELVGKKRPRHQDLLELLDKAGDLRIYGPKIFHGIDVWAGYRSYVGPLPFDGVSVVREINRAGISLVLSSEAHQQSELMSMRLFESLAAGAVVICDQNPFASRFFGNTVLHIDTSLPAEQTFVQVQDHLRWIRDHPADAIELAKRAQEIFLRDFKLDDSLRKIYEGFPARKKRLENLYRPTRTKESVSLVLLMPEFQPAVLERHIASGLAQKNVTVRPTILIDSLQAEAFGDRVQERLHKAQTLFTLEEISFFERRTNGSVRRRRRFGEIMQECVQRFANEEYLCVVRPNERLFSDHLCSLVRSLQDCEEAGAAWSQVLFAHTSADGDHADLGADLNLRVRRSNMPLCCGRFLFRPSSLTSSLATTLPYLDALAMHLLAGTVKLVCSRRCTFLADIQDPFNLQFQECDLAQEREIVADYAPKRLISGGVGLGDVSDQTPAALTLEGMNPAERTKIVVELAHAVPLPAFLKRAAFGAYRLLLRLG